MKKGKRRKILLSSILGVFVLLLGAWLLLEANTYSPTQTPAAISETSQETGAYYLFEAPEESEQNLIFYPGALVDAASYSIWAQQVAKAGYNVYLLKMPFNLAVFNKNAAQQIIAKHPHETYVLAGHSLGGVMASRFSAEHKNEVSGMIYLASYPDQKGSLAKSKLPVLSISASEDGLVEAADIAKAKAYLPEQTQYEVISGGNHAGFGSYGAQKKDGQARITNQEQQEIIGQLIVQWLQTNIPA